MVVVLGYGMIGSTIASELSKNYETTVIDKKNLKTENDSIKILKGEIFDFPEILDEDDIIVSALPGNVSYAIIRKLLKSGKKIIDVSYMKENPFTLTDVALENKGLYVPDAGYAPGLTNIVSGFFYKKYKPTQIEIYDGGLPKIKIPPLDYIITWNTSGLIDLYTRPARIIRNGKILTLDPLENIEKTTLPGIGELESFPVDGLGTLLYTLKDVDIFEKTYRYPGHLEKIKFLRDMDYFSDKKLNGLSPREITEKLFESKLKLQKEDLSIFQIKATGESEKEIFYVDYYDKERGITSMARMTAFPATAIAELVIDNRIDEIGIIPPEYLGFNFDIFQKIIAKLKDKGLNINIS